MTDRVPDPERVAEVETAFAAKVKDKLAASSKRVRCGARYECAPYLWCDKQEGHEGNHAAGVAEWPNAIPKRACEECHQYHPPGTDCGRPGRASPNREAKLVEALRSATDHIRDDLQPQFLRLADGLEVEGPCDWSHEQRLTRLATWWHGVGVEELLDG